MACLPAPQEAARYAQQRGVLIVAAAGEPGLLCSVCQQQASNQASNTAARSSLPLPPSPAFRAALHPAALPPATCTACFPATSTCPQATRPRTCPTPPPTSSRPTGGWLVVGGWPGRELRPVTSHYSGCLRVLCMLGHGQLPAAVGVAANCGLTPQPRKAYAPSHLPHHIHPPTGNPHDTRPRPAPRCMHTCCMRTPECMQA